MMYDILISCVLPLLLLAESYALLSTSLCAVPKSKFATILKSGIGKSDGKSLISTAEGALGRSRAFCATGRNINDLFEDCLVEIPSPRTLKIEGNIPNYVRGTMLRNGPSIFGAVKRGGRRYSHIFEGLAKIAKFHFTEDNKVEFSTKFIRSRYYREIVEKQKDIPPHLVLAPVHPPFSRVANAAGTATSAFKYDNACVNIHQVGGEGGGIMAITDAPFMMQFDPETLETVGKVTYPNKIAGAGGIEFLSTAHPKRLPGDEVTFNYLFEYRPLGKHNVAHIISIDKSNVRRIVGSVELPNDVIPYIHDFSVTEKYAVLCIYPVRSDPKTWVNGKGFLPQLVWDGDKGVSTKIFVFDITEARKFHQATATATAAGYDFAAGKIPSKQKHAFKVFNSRQKNTKKAGKSSSKSFPSPFSPKAPIAYYETDAMFAYHHINAYEEEHGISGSCGAPHAEHSYTPFGGDNVDNVIDGESHSINGSVGCDSNIHDQIEGGRATNDQYMDSSSQSQRQLILDVVGYENANIINGVNAYAYIDKMKDPVQRKLLTPAGVCYRYKLPLPAALVVSPASIAMSGNTATKTIAHHSHNDDESTTERDSMSPPISHLSHPRTSLSQQRFATRRSPLYVHAQRLHAQDARGQRYQSELLTISPLRQGRRYRYSYGYTQFAGPGPDKGDGLQWAIVKQDHQAAPAPVPAPSPVVDRGAAVERRVVSNSTVPPGSEQAAVCTAKIWAQPNCYPSETLFVPSPKAQRVFSLSTKSSRSHQCPAGQGSTAANSLEETAADPIVKIVTEEDEGDGDELVKDEDYDQDEDDGVLLSQVYDGVRRETFLLVLDARTMEELARCYTGVRIPVAFHGQFIPYKMGSDSGDGADCESEMGTVTATGGVSFTSNDDADTSNAGISASTDDSSGTDNL